MPHQLVWNVRDLELSMCGQRSVGAGNLRSIENKIKKRGRVSRCAALTHAFIIKLFEMSKFFIIMNVSLYQACAFKGVNLFQGEPVCAVGSLLLRVKRRYKLDSYLLTSNNCTDKRPRK